MPNLFPNIIPEAILSNTISTANSVKFGSSVRFDFARGDFALTPTGKFAECNDVAAWLEWCQKALLTARYRYLAYSRNYGQEFDDLIPQNLTKEGYESEIKRMVTECLLSDPRTGSVSGFSFNWDGDKCYFTCEIANIRDEKKTLNGSVVMS